MKIIWISTIKPRYKKYNKIVLRGGTTIDLIEQRGLFL